MPQVTSPLQPVGSVSGPVVHGKLQGVVSPIAELPVRHPEQVAAGLGLPFSAERDLTEQVREWIQLPDPISFRQSLFKGLRSFAPNDYMRRNVIAKRVMGLWKATVRDSPFQRDPRNVVVQKSITADDLEVMREAGVEPPPGLVRQMRLTLAKPQPPELVWMTRELDELQDRDPVNTPPGWPDQVVMSKGVSEESKSRARSWLAALLGNLKPDDSNFDEAWKVAEGTVSEPSLVLKGDRLDDEVTIRCSGEAGQTLAKMLRYMQRIANSGASRSWGVMAYTPKTDHDYKETFGIDGDGADKIIEVKLNGKLVKALERAGYLERAKLGEPPPPISDMDAYGKWYASQMEACGEDIARQSGEPSLVLKSAGHRYIKRIRRPNPPPNYRYVYKHPKTKGLTSSSDLHRGAKFKVTHTGSEGHFEVIRQIKAKGLVEVKHDESGKTAFIKETDLHRMIGAYHAKRTTDAKAKEPAASKKKAPVKLKTATMADLQNGEYDNVEGFGPLEDLERQAAGLGKGKDFAVIEQPGGHMLVSKRKRKAGVKRECTGEKTDLKLRSGSGKGIDNLEAEFVLVEAADLVASHKPNALGDFPAHPDYPENVQERRYHTIRAEQEKVDRIAKNLDPAILINTNPDAVNGAPIMDQNNSIIGGNGRTMAIQMAYAQYPEKGKAMKDHLIANARKYGLAAADVRAMEQPALVRRIQADPGKNNTNLKLLGRRMNEALTQGLDPRSEEVAVSQFVTENVCQSLVDSIEPGQTLADFLHSSAADGFVVSLRQAGIIDEFNKAQYLEHDKDGAVVNRLNEDGRDRVERVMAARLLPDADLLQKMNPELRKVLALSTPSIIVAEQHGWPIAASLRLAVEADLHIREQYKGQRATSALSDFLSQTEATQTGVDVGQRIHDDQVALNLLHVIRGKVGPKMTPRDFRGFAARAVQDYHDHAFAEGAAGISGTLAGLAGARVTPSDALDLEFGITPARKQAKVTKISEAKELAAAQKKAEEERKRLVKLESEQQSQLFAASEYMQKPDLVKSMAGSNRLMNRTVWHTQYLVDAAIHNSTSTSSSREPKVDQAKIIAQVMEDVRSAVKKDPAYARDLGAQPITDATIRGLIKAMCAMASLEVAKSLGASEFRKSKPRRPESFDSGPKVGIEARKRLVLFKARAKLRLILDLVKAEQLSLFGRPEQPSLFGIPKPRKPKGRQMQRPPGAGWQMIPKGRKSGFRRRKGKGWEYWYPGGKGIQAKPAQGDVAEEKPVEPQPRLVLEAAAAPKPERSEAVTSAMTQKKGKAKRKTDNELAIEIVQNAAAAGRGLTDSEAVQVAAFTGKGGISGDLNQFYTRTDVAEAMWDVMGVYQDSIERVLEPSCGSGVFLQTAPKGARVTGVELDKAAAAVADALHGHKHEVEAKAFEEFTIERAGVPQNFDAVIANPPYCTRTGDIPLDKPEFKSADKYFIDTSLDHIKDGGTCMLLIHPGVMNNRSPGWQEFRKRLLARAEVLDSFRLPDDTFAHVHCGIAADVLVLRKRDERVGEALMAAHDADELDDTLKALGAWDEPFVKGDYFEDKPDHILGTAMSKEETGWRATVEGDVTKVPDEMRRLTEAKLKSAEKDPASKPITFEALADLGNQNDLVKEYMKRGEAKLAAAAIPPSVGNVRTFARRKYLYIGEPPKWVPMETVDDVSQIITNSGDVAVKEAHEIALDLADLIRARDGGEYYKSRNLRRMAADRVKAWVAENGIPGSHRALGELSKSAPQLLNFMACVDSNGSLSDILSKDAAVTLKTAEVDRSDIMSVANYIARRNRGYVTPEDLQHNWEGWEGQSEDELRGMLLAGGDYALDEMGRTGDTTPIQHMEDYLTGNLYDKLEMETDMLGAVEGEHKAQLERQISAIKQRIETKRRSIDDIPIQLRVMGWMKLDYFDAYMNSPEGRMDLFHQKPRQHGDALLRMVYDKGIYTVQSFAPPEGYSRSSGYGSAPKEYQPGEVISQTANGYDFLKYMNRLSLKRERCEDVEAHVERRFNEWIKASEHRSDLEDLYNRTFNAEFRRDFSGDDLGLEGMTDGIIPHDFQNEAVRWAAETGRGILGQDVGLGKTFIAILLARYRKQNGQARRPFVVVPKSVATNWAEETETLFPGSRVLVIGETRIKSKVAAKKAKAAARELGLFGDAFDKYVEENGWITRSDTDVERNKKLAMVKQNEYDLIICTKPAFDRIPLKEETIDKYEKDEFDYVRAGGVDSIRSGSKTQQTADRKIAKLKATWAGEKLSERFQYEESLVYWEDLGIDCLMADEAHCFPAGTLVDGKPIEQYRAGDYVWSFDHATGDLVKSKVVNIQIQVPDDLYSVHLNDGTNITCTGQHPIYTPNGYMFAKDLLAGDTLYKNGLMAGEDAKEIKDNGNASLRVVRERTAPDASAGMAPQEGEDAVLLRQKARDEMEMGASGNAQATSCWSEKGDRKSGVGREGSQEGARRLAEYAGSSGKGESENSSVGTETEGARGKWLSDAGAPDATLEGAGVRVETRDGGPDSSGATERIPEPLQGGHSESWNNDRGRGGRRVAPIAYPQGPGPEEGCLFKPVRVERVEVLEPGSDGRFGDVCPDGLVYNLEVENHHTYLAQGILVHNCYKNLYTARSRFGQNPKFLGGSSASKQAKKMMHMSRYVRDQAPGNGVYFLTATPTKNSPLEVFNMLQHIAPEAFRELGIENAEQFIDRFCKLEQRLVLTPPGSQSSPKKDDEDDPQYQDEFEGAGNLETATCVTGFTNLRELESVMDKHMMIQTATDVGLKIPDANYQTHLVEMTDEQKAVYQLLRYEATTLDKDEDPGGMFRIMDRMKKAAQDLELFDPKEYPDWYVNSPKYKACVEAAAKGARERGGQIIFCDHNASHERLKAMLMSEGLKESEIGIINAHVAKDSAERQAIGNRFNRGEVKVVIGNTGTMGEGVNLQGKKHEHGTTDIHHLDQPWDPGTMHQRNGRGVRQGNNADQVDVHTYLATSSFDGFRHSTLKGKERWLDKLRSGADNISNDMEGQSMDDIEMLAMLSDDPDAALRSIKERRVSAESAWYAKQAQESVDAFYQWQRKVDRIRHLKGQTDAKERLSGEAERLKRQLLRNEILPLEIKEYLKAGNTDPVAVNTRMTGEGDSARLAGNLVSPGSVLVEMDVSTDAARSIGKWVVESVNLTDRTVRVRSWGSSSSYNRTIDDLMGEGFKVAQATAVDELKDTLRKNFNESWKSPIDAINHIGESVLEQSRDLLDEHMKDWYAKYSGEYGERKKLIMRTDKGIEAKPVEEIGKHHGIVYPWGSDRAALVQAIVQANEGGEVWREYQNDLLHTGRQEYGYSIYSSAVGSRLDRFTQIAKEAEDAWKKIPAGKKPGTLEPPEAALLPHPPPRSPGPVPSDAELAFYLG